MAASPGTPIRVICSDNICIVCGFCFVSTNDGGVIKNTDRKLRLTEERVMNIKRVVDIDIDIDSTKFTSSSGICIKCYRKVEKHYKLSSELKEIKESLQLNILKTISNKQKKRLLRSPVSDQPQKASCMEDPFSSTPTNHLHHSVARRSLATAFIESMPPPLQTEVEV